MRPAARHRTDWKNNRTPGPDYHGPNGRSPDSWSLDVDTVGLVSLDRSLRERNREDAVVVRDGVVAADIPGESDRTLEYRSSCDSHRNVLDNRGHNAVRTCDRSTHSEVYRWLTAAATPLLRVRVGRLRGWLRHKRAAKYLGDKPRGTPAFSL